MIPFEQVLGRDGDLMAKGGNSQLILANMEEIGKVPYYENEESRAKLSTTKKLDKLTPCFKRNTGRKASFGNLYRDDDDLSPDHYDSIKIAKADIKSRKRSDATFVDMRK